MEKRCKYMWAVLGSHGGVFGLFNSKWKAQSAINCLWNIERPTIKRYAVKNLPGRRLEIITHHFKILP